jgi:hypothetical protein
MACIVFVLLKTGLKGIHNTVLNFREIDTTALIDLLVQQTALFTSKILSKNSIGIEQLEYELLLIQGELNSRSKEHVPARMLFKRRIIPE